MYIIEKSTYIHAYDKCIVFFIDLKFDECVNKMAIDYSVYYIDPSDRIECMLVCSLNSHINWAEEGMKMATWSYNIVGKGEAENISEVFRKYSVLNIDRRKKHTMRSMGLGDIILFGDTPWIVTAFGFVRVPSILWSKISSDWEQNE